MRVKNKEFTIAATIKIKFFKIIHYKILVGRTAVIHGNYTLFTAENIIGNTYVLTLDTVFAGSLFRFNNGCRFVLFI